METNKDTSLTSKDYLLISFIGFSFALFSIPIIPNIVPGLVMNVKLFAIILVLMLVASNLGLLIASLIARKIPVILQIAKFAAVGAFNTFLDWGVVNLLMEFTSITAGLIFSMFSGIGFIVANVGSFFWNKYWTFTTQKEDGTTENKKGNIIQFFVVSIIGFGVKVGVVSLIVNFIGIKGGFTGEQWANIGNVSGTAFAMVWNFIGYKFWVFKK